MSGGEEAPLRLAVGIATRGRAGVLLLTLRAVARQTRRPERILVCYSAPDDVAGIDAMPGLELLQGPVGSSAQRNVLLDAAGDCDALLFLDDDFVPAPDYVAATLAAFALDPAIVVTTGAVLADGAKGPGLSHATADLILRADAGAAIGPWPGLSATFNGYGCNMAVRLAPIRRHGLRFDERLPLYGWYEDIDFSRRLGRHGRTVRVAAARGVHLGTKSGRTSGRRLGYSQVANPIYLLRKRVYPLPATLRSVARHVVVNLLRSLRAEPFIDRRGRLRGNLLALADLLRGRIDPLRVLDL